MEHEDHGVHANRGLEAFAMLHEVEETVATLGEGAHAAVTGGTLAHEAHTLGGILTGAAPASGAHTALIASNAVLAPFNIMLGMHEIASGIHRGGEEGVLDGIHGGALTASGTCGLSALLAGGMGSAGAAGAFMTAAPVASALGLGLAAGRFLDHQLGISDTLSDHMSGRAGLMQDLGVHFVDQGSDEWKAWRQRAAARAAAVGGHYAD